MVLLTSLQKLTAPERRLANALSVRGFTVIAICSPASSLARSVTFVEDGGDSIEAAEAFLEYRRSEAPHVVGERLALVGSSAGAIALPAVAARLEPEPEAAVVIGGGARLFEIVTESPVTSRQLLLARLDRDATSGEIPLDDRPVPDLDLGDAVLARSRLDPYHTAPRLADRPVLMLHAVHDRVVPARYERLHYLQPPDSATMAAWETPMSDRPLRNRSFLVFVGDLYEDLELWYPKLRLTEAGADVLVAGPEANTSYAGKNGYPCRSDVAVADVDAARFHGVVCPGGFMPDKLRRDPKVLQLVRDFDLAKKPIAAICHGGWIPISAGVYAGVRVTGSPGIKDDLVNAGALWEDAPVVVDRHFVSSRRPDDLPDFCRAILEMASQPA